MAADAPADDELVAVGKIGPAHGTRGEAFVEPWTDAPDERFGVGAVLVTDSDVVGSLTVESSRLQGARRVVRFAGVEDRVAAQALRGVQLMISVAQRGPLEDPDEFYDSELVGLIARSPGGEQFGPVTEVLHIASADYLAVVVAGTDRLVPFVAAIVPEVNVAGGYVVIDPPEGLFEL